MCGQWAGELMMAKRTTMMIDDDVDKKIRSLRAKLILETSKNVSYSQVINELLRKSLKQK